MSNVGDTITVSKEEAKDLRKKGWMPRGDIVTMMYVGLPEEPVSNRSRHIVSQTSSAIRMRALRARRRAAA